MNDEEWAAMSPDQRYMLVTMRDEAEEYFMTNMARHPMLVLGVAAWMHHVKSQPEYQAGA